MQIMTFFAFLLVLLSAFAAAFARHDFTRGDRSTGLLRTSTGNRVVSLTARNLKAVTAPLKEVEDAEDDEDDDEDEEDKPDTEDDFDSDTEDDFDSDTESIDGEEGKDPNCKSGRYTLKYMNKQRFTTGKKYKEVSANTLDLCGKSCAKYKKSCGTFNWSKKSKKCTIFSTSDIGRDKMADTSATAAFLQCLKN
jgi:hypothetical protein